MHRVRSWKFLTKRQYKEQPKEMKNTKVEMKNILEGIKAG